MDVAEFAYDLPPHAIAQAPPAARDGGRLLVIERRGEGLSDRRVLDLPDLLRAGDCLVLNDSRVIPARVLAEDARGRAVELLFLEARTPTRWRALVRPGRRCRPGAALRVGDARLSVTA
ncbi:MAG TPA: S-adenosylmethionine:tRNA ribosyltransferase-isomerase, partial [Methylomirabilota bacterium]|nr:S-adenosylmethionine:tRNA ribosyltransferase-isomerase [Methylomirabilota bacterium]